MKKKLQKVIGVLSTMKDFNMKPNFSELERKYGIDRHTIKKYYENGGIPERKKFKKVSKWDPLYDLIISLSDVPGSYLMSIFQVLNYEYNGNPSRILLLLLLHVPSFWHCHMPALPVNRLLQKDSDYERCKCLRRNCNPTHSVSFLCVSALHQDMLLHILLQNVHCR